VEGREEALLCKKTNKQAKKPTHLLKCLSLHVRGRKHILNNKIYIRGRHSFHNFWKCTLELCAVRGFVFGTCSVCAPMNGCIRRFSFVHCEIEHKAFELAAFLHKSSTVGLTQINMFDEDVGGSLLGLFSLLVYSM